MREFCADTDLQVPNHWHRQEHEQEVCGDVDDGVERPNLCEDLAWRYLHLPVVDGDEDPSRPALVHTGRSSMVVSSAILAEQ